MWVLGLDVALAEVVWRLVRQRLAIARYEEELKVEVLVERVPRRPLHLVAAEYVSYLLVLVFATAFVLRLYYLFAVGRILGRLIPLAVKLLRLALRLVV